MHIEGDAEIDDLSERIRKNFIHIENSFEEILGEVQKALDDIVSESGKLVGAEEAFADQFGSKVIALASDLKKSVKIDINDVNMYIDSLENFQKEIIYYGARWVRKIGFRHKFTISRIENNRRSLLKLTRELKDLLSESQRELKGRERAENIARKVSKLKADLSASKRALKAAKRRLKEHKGLIEKYEKEMQALRGDKELREVREFREAEEAFEEKVKIELRYLEKPVLKSLKLIERGVIDKDRPNIVKLERFIDDPKRILLDGDVTTVEEGLISLQELLKENKLKLKGVRNRKALEAVSQILEGDKIKEYKEKFIQYAEESRRRLDVSGTLEKTRKLEEVKREFQRMKKVLDNITKERGRLERELKLGEEKIDEYHSKLGELIENFKE